MGSIPLKASIAQFFVNERDRLVRYARRLIDDNAERDGEDIVHDVALSLLSRADLLEPIESLSAYVYESVRHRIVDHFRSRRYTVSLDGPDGEGDESSLEYALSRDRGDFERNVTLAELRRSIAEAISALPEDQKRIVVETEVKGRTFRELSEEWGVPVGTLLARKSRAIAKVRKSLGEFKP